MSRKMDIKNKSIISKHIIDESLIKYQGKHLNRIYCSRKGITFYMSIISTFLS